MLQAWHYNLQYKLNNFKYMLGPQASSFVVWLNNNEDSIRLWVQYCPLPQQYNGSSHIISEFPSGNQRIAYHTVTFLYYEMLMMNAEIMSMYTNQMVFS